MTRAYLLPGQSWLSRFSRPLALVIALALGLGALTWTAPGASATAQTYSYTGGPQIYVVPPGVTSINVTMSGAQGASPSGGGTGGLGGSVSATIAVNPGEVLQVMVGGSGTVSSFNGGGTTGGGGATDIRRPTFSTSSSCAYNLTCDATQRIVVAGGGGSGAWYSTGSSTGGGDGGSGGQVPTAGTVAGTFTSATVATAGGAATANAGGTAGTGGGSGAGSGTGAAGSLAAGGSLGWKPGANGGGGGAGYYGGGGGGSVTYEGAGGGGGGTSWAGGTGVTNASFTDGDRSGSGVVTIDPPSAITNAAFGFTGAAQTFTVPSGVTELAVRMYGAKGSALGDIVSGILPVTPGDVLQVNIGGAGVVVSTPVGGGSVVGGQGGWNGGGAVAAISANEGSPGGGGASDIRVSPYSLSSRVIVAGGGGGVYAFFAQYGWGAGAGGSGATGDGGTGGRNQGELGGGTGGTLTAGGANTDTSPPAATAGTFGAGGSGASTNNFAGGGGGYWGGAAGLGAGGGSSYASVTGPDATGQGVGNVLGQSGAAFTHAQGNGGDGMAVITAMPIGVSSPATGVTRTQADISGTVNPKFLATTPTVQYSTSQSTVAAGGGTSANLTGPSSASVLAGDSVQAVSGSISGLSASTTYYFRVCAQSVAGNGCGSISSFTTLPVGFTPPVMTTTSATATDATSATASAPLNPGTGPATVTFQCSTSSTFATIAATGTAAESPMSGVSSQSATGGCTGLTASTTYYVRAVATVTVGGNTYTYVASAATITTSAAPAPSPSGGGSSSASATPTPTPSSSALPPLTPVVPTAPAAVTGPVLLVNGQPQTVTVTPTARDQGLSISGADFSMTIEGVGATGNPLGLTADGALILENDRFAKTTGTGFLADSPVKLYLFSDPLYVGDVLTNATGVFNGSVQIPLTVAPGRHTLQANGYTADGEVRSLSLPVVVKADNSSSPHSLKRAKAVVQFSPLSARLDSAARTALRSLVRTSGSSAKVTSIVGFVQPTVTTVNDVQLSTRRARAVSDYLRAQGLRGRVVVRGKGAAAGAGAEARRVNVVVAYVANRHR